MKENKNNFLSFFITFIIIFVICAVACNLIKGSGKNKKEDNTTTTTAVANSNCIKSTKLDNFKIADSVEIKEGKIVATVKGAEVVSELKNDKATTITAYFYQPAGIYFIFVLGESGNVYKAQDVMDMSKKLDFVQVAEAKDVKCLMVEENPNFNEEYDGYKSYVYAYDGTSKTQLKYRG